MENRTFFTIGQAATETGKAKSTIKKAIDSGELTVAEKTKRGFKIEASELFRVFPRKQPERSSANENEQTETPKNDTENSILQIKLDVANQRFDDAEKKIEELKAERADLRSQRDAWQKQAETNGRLLTDQREQKEPPKQGFKIFGIRISRAG